MHRISRKAKLKKTVGTIILVLAVVCLIVSIIFLILAVKDTMHSSWFLIIPVLLFILAILGAIGRSKNNKKERFKFIY